MHVSSSDDTSGWTQADWRARRREMGFSVLGGAATTCVSITNSHIANIQFGIGVAANNMLVSGNDIGRFGDDGIDYNASNILISKNYIHDGVYLADGSHPDGMQGYPGKYSNVVIDSNRVIRQTDPNLPFPNFLQGIDAFDGDWTNLTVTNNVVLAASCWGIGFGSVHGGRIMNNTVLDDQWPADKWPWKAGNCRPDVTIGDKTHDGSSSNDVVVRNNLSNGLSIYNVGPNIVADHNICLAIKGVCSILTYFPDGKPNRGTLKPGVYGDHNIIDRRGPEGEFVNFDPANFVFDLRLKSGATAIGAGNPAEAPAVDITGAARGNPIDIGAYRYSPVK
jgi:Right handed beta helix region